MCWTKYSRPTRAASHHHHFHTHHLDLPLVSAALCKAIKMEDTMAPVHRPAADPKAREQYKLWCDKRRDDVPGGDDEAHLAVLVGAKATVRSTISSKSSSSDRLEVSGGGLPAW